MSEARNNEQLMRIVRMESMYDEGCAAVEAMLLAIEQYQAAQSKIKALADYYQGPLWMADFDDDRAGKIPKDMKRGILTEDAIYDLLIDQDQMLKLLKRIEKTDF